MLQYERPIQIFVKIGSFEPGFYDAIQCPKSLKLSWCVFPMSLWDHMEAKPAKGEIQNGNSLSTLDLAGPNCLYRAAWV